MRLGQNQITAAALVMTASRGRPMTPEGLNKQMGLGYTRSLDTLERLTERGILRRSGSGFLPDGPKWGEFVEKYVR
jgi:hypothetical protein